MEAVLEDIVKDNMSLYFKIEEIVIIKNPMFSSNTIGRLTRMDGLNGKVAIVLQKRKELVQVIFSDNKKYWTFNYNLKHTILREDLSNSKEISMIFDLIEKEKIAKKARLVPKDIHKRVTPQTLYDIYSLIYIHTRTTSKEAKFCVSFDLDECRHKFLGEAESICLRELRHLQDECSQWSDNQELKGIDERFDIYRPIRHTIDIILRNQYGEEPSSRSRRYLENKYFRGFLTFDEINKSIVKKLRKTGCLDFKSLINWYTVKSLLGDHDSVRYEWNDNYAGHHWVDFAEACENLNKSSYDKLWFYIDRAINFAHNNGTFMDKFYHYSEIQEAADFISDEDTTIEDVLKRASYGVACNCRRYMREIH